MMISPDLIHPVDVDRVPDLVHRVRALGFFTEHIGNSIAAIGAREGLIATLDSEKISRVFPAWVEQLTAQKAFAARDRRDYVAFGAALLFKHLLASEAIRVLPAPGVDHAQRGAAKTRGGPSNKIAFFWPEAYLATSYCLTVLDAVLEQEKLAPYHVQPMAGDLRAWWSFRETFREDQWVAVPFLDLLIGNEPSWTFPYRASARPAFKQ